MKKKKEPEAYLGGRPKYDKLEDPKKVFLNHVQNQANRMAELLGESQGEQYVKDALKEWPHLIKRELERFGKRKA